MDIAAGMVLVLVTHDEPYIYSDRLLKDSNVGLAVEMYLLGWIV